MQEVVLYNAACRALVTALAAARTIEDIKEVSNRTEALRAYAQSAKDRGLQMDAMEIHTRAERRLGELILALKADGIGKQGAGLRGPRRTPENVPVRLQDFGLNKTISSASQRLAQLPADRFESELALWRARAPKATRIEVPLQMYRRPSLRGERQRVSQRLGRTTFDADDRFAAFRAPDGRRIADWRIGELDRLEEIAKRQIAVIQAARAKMPVVGDPLATLEMVFTPDELLAILRSTWTSVDAGNAGLRAVPRRAICENCGCSFEARNLSGKARAGLVQENRFCGRRCAALAQSKARNGADHARAAAD